MTKKYPGLKYTPPSGKPLYRCTECTARTRKNYAKEHNWTCQACKKPLRVKEQKDREFTKEFERRMRIVI